MKRMLKAITCMVTILVLSTFTSCTTTRQGAEGRITEVSGNLMPGPGRKLPEPVPLKTTLLFTIALAQDELVRNEQGLYAEPDEKLIIKKVETDNSGHYKVNLQPGVYSVLVQTKDGWFASETDENGVLNKVTVENKLIVTRNITVNYRAAY